MLLRGGIALPAYRRERLETPDGDFLDLDWVDGQSPAMARPLLVLFHGLEGSSRSHYARALMHAVAEHGWHGVVVHFRGCSGETNRLARAYHSGDSAEIAWVLEALSLRNAQLCAVGVSLGGNALLKYLGEHGTQARLQAAAAVSVPYDLAAANRMLSHGMGLLYARHFLRSLIPGSLAKAERFPDHPGYTDLAAIRTARTLRDFDGTVTAPLHGFRDADDYYTRSSSAQYLLGISVPTLLIHAANDPFLPVTAIPSPERLPACVQLEVSSRGGHVGFVSGTTPGHLAWLPQRLLGHLGQYLGNNRVA